MDYQELESTLDKHEAQQRELESMSSTAASKAKLKKDDVNSMSYALESMGVGMEGVLSTSWEVIKGLSSLASKAFIKTFETIGVWLDKTGTKELERLRKRLDASSADGAGIAKSESIARALTIEGSLIVNHVQHIEKLVAFSKTISDQVCSQVALTARKVYTDVGMSRADDPEEFHALVHKVMSTLSHSRPTIDLLGPKNLSTKFIGDRSLFTERSKPFDVKPPVKVKDAETLKVIDALNAATVGVSGSPGKIKAIANSNRVAILTRSEIEELLKALEKLSDELYRLKGLSKFYSNDPYCSTSFYLLHHRQNKVEGEMVYDKENDRYYASGQSIDTDDKFRTSVLGQYLRMDLMDHKLIFQKNTRLLISVFQSYVDYIYFSLKYHR